MNKVVYLAGAMSCYFNTKDHDYPKNWREDVKKYVKDNYDEITVISPTDYFEVGENYHQSDSEVMRFDLRMVREADIILVNLRDLDKSLGTSDEIFYAFISGKPIIGFLENADDICKVHPWKLEQIDRIETGQNAIGKALSYIYRYYVDREY